MATEAIAKEAQRKSPRWQVVGSKPAKVDLGPAGTGLLVNIGEGGIRVQSLAPLRLNTELPIRIEMPDKAEFLKTTGTVVWSKANGAAGIRFNSLGENENRILKTWLKDLEMGTLATTAAEGRDEFTDIIAQIKARNLNNAEALDLIVRRASSLSSVHGAAIALGTPENMVCLATTGNAPEIGTHISQSEGLTGECVRGRKLVHCPDTQKDPRVGAELSRKMNLGSAVVAPLVVNGDLRGVLEAFAPRPHAFDPAAIQSLTRLADAIVYITHGLTPQRKLATVTPMSSPAPRIQPVSPVLTAVQAPTISTPTKVQPMPAVMPISEKPVAVPPPALKITSPPAVEPIAAKAAPVTPIAEPVAITPTTAAPVAPRVKSATVTAVPVPVPSRVTSFGSTSGDNSEVNARREAYSRLLGITQPEPPKSHNGVWIVAGVLAVVLAGGSYFLWHHHQQTLAMANLASAAMTTPAATPSPEASAPVSTTPGGAQTVLTTQAATSPISTPALTSAAAPAAKPSAQTSKTSSPEAVESKKDDTRKEDTKKDKAAPEVKKAQPEPMVLAESTSRRPLTAEPEPSAPAPIMAGAAVVPGISLPGNSSVPKLTAEVSKTRTGGALLKQVAPVYPIGAKAMALQGKVELLVHVNKMGAVDKIRIANGNPILANAAVDAVKKWQYDPLKLNGEAIDMDTSVTLRFTLPH